MIKNLSKLLIIIILLGALVRLINLNQPLLEGASTRQVETAMIARNFYNHGFKLFYPQIDIFGNDPGYLMQEFYFIPFIAALFYKLLGGVNEWVLRLISVFFYVLATFMIYKLASYYFNKKTGIVSALCFTISPLSIYLGRAVHPEMAIAFFNIATIYSFTRWVERRSWFYGMSTAASFTMAVLLKIPNLYLAAPLLFIGLFSRDKGIFKGGQFWSLSAISFIIIVIFNFHQYAVRAAYPNPAMANFNLATIPNYIKFYLTGQEFYKKVYEDLVTYTLTPIGFVIFILGLSMRVESKKEWLFYIWLSAVGLFFLLMPAQCMQGYYQMHILPIASIIIARTVCHFSEAESLKDMFFRNKMFGFIFLSFLFLVVLRHSYTYYRIPENFKYVVETGRAVDQLTERDALVIASIENSPDLVYYSDRKGWPFTIDLETKRRLDLLQGEDVTGRTYDPIIYVEQLRTEGASYFASASMSEFLGHEKFSKYMRENYKAVKETPHFIIFELRKTR